MLILAHRDRLFQSLTRDSNHSNRPARAVRQRQLRPFQSLTRDSNHSNIALGDAYIYYHRFQSLTRDSNHSNSVVISFAPQMARFQSLTRDSNHSNRVLADAPGPGQHVSIPHAG